MVGIDAILAVIAVLVGVIALVFASKQYFDARVTLEKLADSTSSLDGVSRSLSHVQQSISTRTIGDFPDFLEEITKVLGGAEKEVWICCDVPGYGLISSPKLFFRYLEQLQVKSLRVPIHMVTSQGPLLEDLRRRIHEVGWDAYSSKYAEGITEMMERYHLGPESMLELSGEKYVELLGEAQGKIVRSLDPDTRKIDVTDTNSIVPLQFWVVDGTDAVFALARYTKQAREVGFRTSDRGLIQALIGICGKYRAEARASA
ncbi:MAG TPA: hypothetical protein VFP21_09140 [Solirubrobacterales bacterium]|nr:hypothetical protein [Solirubrobacterales bacterium]